MVTSKYHGRALTDHVDLAHGLVHLAHAVPPRGEARERVRLDLDDVAALVIVRGPSGDEVAELIAAHPTPPDTRRARPDPRLCPPPSRGVFFVHADTRRLRLALDHGRHRPPLR